MSSNIYKYQEANIRKTWMFFLLFLTFVVTVGWFFSYLYGSPVILYFAIIAAVLMNFFSYWFSDKIILRIHQAHPVTREEYFDLWNVTENLAITAGLPMPRLFIIDDEAPNAFATGRNKEHAVICVTTGLIKILNRSELEGVIAHELAHIGNNDILLSTMAVIMVGFIALLSDFFIRSQMWSNDRNRQHGGLFLLMIGFALAALTPIAATLMRLAISRRREFLADATGVLLTRYPEGLAHALKKISSSEMPLHNANNATAHLFISNPFGIKALTGFHRLFMTHPPVEERIKALLGQ